MLNPNEKLASVIKLQNLAPDQGTEILGQVYTEGPQAFAPVGDINQDGIDDFVVGDPGKGKGEDKTFLIWGGNYTQPIDLTQFQSSQGVIFWGQSGFCGYVATGVGKVNRDTIPDFLIVCPFANNETGIIFVIFGRTNFPSMVDLTKLTPSDGIKIVGDVASPTGTICSSAGDVNRDGWADFALTINTRTTSGAPNSKVLIFYGGDLTGPIYLNNLTTVKGIMLEGVPPTGIGYTITLAGNDTNTANPRLLIGDPFANQLLGKIYVVSNVSTLISPVNVDSLDATHTTEFLGYSNTTLFGFAAAASVDVSSGNIKDFIVSLMNRDSASLGKWYLIPNQGLGHSINLADLTPNQYTTISSGTWRPSPFIQWLGDLNNDGNEEFALHAGDYTGAPSRVYLFNRGMLTTNSTITLDALTAAQGVIFEGPTNTSRLGQSFSRAGDIDHDGLQDLLIKQRGGVGLPGSVKSYLLYGKYLRSLLSMTAPMPSPSLMTTTPVSVTSVVSSSATTTKVGDSVTTMPISVTSMTSNGTKTTNAGDSTTLATQASTTQTQKHTLIPVPATSAAHRNTPFIGSILSTLTDLLASSTATFSTLAQSHQPIVKLMPANAGQYVQPTVQNTVPDVASTILLGRVLWEIGKNSVNYIKEKLSSAYDDSDTVQSTQLETRHTHITSDFRTNRDSSKANGDRNDSCANPATANPKSI